MGRLSDWSEEEVVEWLKLKCKVGDDSLPAFARARIDGGLLEMLAMDDHAKDLAQLLDNNLKDVDVLDKMRFKAELKKLDAQSAGSSSGSASVPEVLDAKKSRLRRVGVLGAGAFGECFKVLDRSGQGFALKVVRCASDDDLNAVIEEARKMIAHEHRHLVNCVRVFVETGVVARFACVQMELCAGGDLGKIREHREKTKEWFGAMTLARWLREALSGLQFLHAHRITHRDVKPANMLLFGREGSYPETMCLKLGDFGLARKMDRVVSMVSGKTGMAGTPLYIAPEVWRGEAVSTVSDVWSLGVSFVELASLETPPGGTGIQHIVGCNPDNMREYLKRLEAWKVDVSVGSVGLRVREELKAMLEFEAERRPTCDTLLNKLPADSEQSMRTDRELVRECAWSLYDILNKDERCRAVIDDARGWKQLTSSREGGSEVVGAVKVWRTENEDIMRGVRAFVDAGAPSSAKLWQDFDLHAVTLAHCRRRETGFLVRGCYLNHYRWFPLTQIFSRNRAGLRRNHVQDVRRET
jgi:serine/threonine protein kinase